MTSTQIDRQIAEIAAQFGQSPETLTGALEFTRLYITERFAGVVNEDTVRQAFAAWNRGWEALAEQARKDSPEWREFVKAVGAEFHARVNEKKEN